MGQTRRMRLAGPQVVVPPPSTSVASVLCASLLLLAASPAPVFAHPSEAEAIAALTAAIRAWPGDAAAHCRRAELETAAGRLADAERDYLRVLRADPGNRDAALGRIEVARRAGLRAEALRRADRFLLLHPADPAGWLARGRLLREVGEPREAGRALDRAIAWDDSPTPDAYLERAGIAIEAGRPAAAAAVLSLGIRRLRGAPALRWKLAELAASHGRLALALDQVGPALPAGTDPAAVALHRGDLLARAGRPVQARAEWTAALERLEDPAAPCGPGGVRLRRLLSDRLAVRRAE